MTQTSLQLPGRTSHGVTHEAHLLLLSLTGLRLRLLCELSLLSLLLSFFADSLSRSAAAASFFACAQCVRQDLSALRQNALPAGRTSGGQPSTVLLKPGKPAVG